MISIKHRKANRNNTRKEIMNGQILPKLKLMRFLDKIIRIAYPSGSLDFKMNLIKTLLEFRRVDKCLKNNLENL